MARTQQVIFSYSCDVCGNEIPAGTEGASRRFSFEGRDYEIDLCERDQKGLDKALGGLAAYTEAGRRIGSGGRQGRSRRSAGASAGLDLFAVRQWARDNGYEVSERGRISQQIKDAYLAAAG